jgi:hypothetical protein
VSGKQFEHMVEEADPRGDLGLAGAIQGNRQGDIGLGGATADARGAHHQNPLRNKRPGLLASHGEKYHPRCFWPISD